MSVCNVEKDVIFRDLAADDPDPEITEIESACMRCFEMGTTRVLLTKIPFYKEVVVMSFACEKCGFENNEIQLASEIQEKGVRIALKVENAADLNRRVVRSDFTAVSIPEVELEIPAQSQKGEITTVEGIIERTIRGLSQDQEKRREEHPMAAEAIENYIDKLENLKNLNKNFSLILEDISGNCFIENPNAPCQDHSCETTHFKRTKEQDQLLGFYPDNRINEPENDEKHLLKPIAEGSWPIEELKSEIFKFDTNCPQCKSPCDTNMKMTNIPHFKEVIIMATVCENCGCKTNEVKSGGGIEEQGIRFEVRVENKNDLTRDVLKSETCSLFIPEVDCSVGAGALSGRFTTVEGILNAMKEQLEDNGLMFHDSADSDAKLRFECFVEKLVKIAKLEMPATLVLDDPAGNSYVQSLRDDKEPDEKLKIERYYRNFEQNEELGLNDMKTENYE